MVKVLMVYPELCTGCRICEVACSFSKSMGFNPAISRIKIIKIEEEGIDYPSVCLHCEDPICVLLCPVSAIYVDENEAKVIDYTKCMGCRTCVITCPLGGAVVNPVSGKTIKCDLCGGDPMCVKFCPTKAIEWVDVSVANQRIKKAPIERYFEALRKGKGKA